MKTTVELSMKDVAEIANRLDRDDKYTPLEIALAKKCEKTFLALTRVNEEKNRLFHMLYSHFISIPTDLRKAFDEKRSKELMSQAVALNRVAEEMTEEAGNIGEGAFPLVSQNINTEKEPH